MTNSTKVCKYIAAELGKRIDNLEFLSPLNDSVTTSKANQVLVCTNSDGSEVVKGNKTMREDLLLFGIVRADNAAAAEQTIDDFYTEAVDFFTSLDDTDILDGAATLIAAYTDGIDIAVDGNNYSFKMNVELIVQY